MQSAATEEDRAQEGTGAAPDAPGKEEPALRPQRRRHLFLPRLMRNLGCGVKIALLRRVQPHDLGLSPSALAVLVVADIVVNIISSRLLVGAEGSFAYATVPSFLFHLPVLLLCALLVGKVLHRRELLLAIPVALLSLSLVIEISHYLLEWLSRAPRLRFLQEHLEAADYFRFFWWWCAAAVVFILRLPLSTRARRVGGAFLFLLLVVLPLWSFPRGDLWVAPYGASESGEIRLTEEVLDAQSRLLDQQLAALLPGRKGSPQLYFVGFAGDAAQDVFTREASAVEHLFLSRFGTAGRSLLLANNPRTATTLPFATAANLERALARVGRVMDREEDILFLFLTSHGTPEHVLTVDNSPLELDGLTPEMLRRMLNRSGIRWKVLVVSACFSGGFIEPLKDEQTLIMTAADPVHESFGCGFGEKFTWFGEALLDDALRRTYSFPEAFEEARKTIRRWEEEQGETPSNPQIFLGREIAPRLRRLESSLEAAGRRREEAPAQRRGGGTGGFTDEEGA